MKKPTTIQLDLFEWADSRPIATVLPITRPSAVVIDLTPIIVANMPDVDPQYPEPAKVIQSGRKRA